MTMRKQRGLSLVELMIAITLGLVLMAGVVQMFLSSRAVFSSQQGLSRNQETGRLAVDFIAREARMAGYYGCFTPTPDDPLGNVGLTIGGLYGNFDQGIVGYDNRLSLPHGAAVDLGAAVAPNVSAVDSILVIRSANRVGATINADNTASSLFGYTTEGLVNSCVGNLCINTVAVATDCLKSRVFQISNLTVAGNTLRVTHADNWGGDPTKTTEKFSAGEILPFNTNVYFVARGASGSNSLWQKTNADAAVELLEGVERFSVTYNTTKDPVYRSAAAITAANKWPIVQSIRIELLVRSVDNSLKEPQPYTFRGVTFTPPATDLHMYQVFSSTIAIRSRVSVYN